MFSRWQYEQFPIYITECECSGKGQFQIYITECSEKRTGEKGRGWLLSLTTISLRCFQLGCFQYISSKGREGVLGMGVEGRPGGCAEGAPPTQYRTPPTITLCRIQMTGWGCSSISAFPTCDTHQYMIICSCDGGSNREL